MAQGLHLLNTIIFKYVYWYMKQISGERLQDHWSSGLAHLSRRLTGELIVYPCSGVRPSSVCPSVVRPSFTFSKIFSSETAWPIKAKLQVEHPMEGGTKVYINGPGHMTKMAAMAINSKNLLTLLHLCTYY